MAVIAVLEEGQARLASRGTMNTSRTHTSRTTMDGSWRLGIAKSYRLLDLA